MDHVIIRARWRRIVSLDNRTAGGHNAAAIAPAGAAGLGDCGIRTRDLEALACRDAQARDDPSIGICAQPNRRSILGTNTLPTNEGVLVGSYAGVARMLDELAEVPGVRGVMLTFDDFVIGMEQFGTRILRLIRCRDVIKKAA
ncbi:MAG TPA: hypothetical protein VGM32_05255 [Rhodopila sp.]